MAITFTSNISNDNVITVTWSGFNNNVTLYRTTKNLSSLLTEYNTYASNPAAEKNPTGAIIDAAGQGVFGAAVATGLRKSASYTDKDLIPTADGLTYYYIAIDGTGDTALAAIKSVTFVYDGEDGLEVDSTLDTAKLKSEIYNAAAAKSFKVGIDSGYNYIVLIQSETELTTAGIKSAVTTTTKIDNADVALISSGNIPNLTGYEAYMSGSLKVGYNKTAAAASDSQLTALTKVSTYVLGTTINVAAIADPNSYMDGDVVKSHSKAAIIQYKKTTDDNWTTWTDTSSDPFYGRAGGYNITGLTVGSTYQIRIAALGDSPYFNSSFVNLDNVKILPTLETPTNLAATASSGKVNLTWSSVTGATGYTIQYAANATDSTSSWTEVTAAASSKEITGLTNGTEYGFRVYATGPSGQYFNSSATTVVKATPAAA